jgi:glycerol-3-phosphate acyltransferase PlsY
MKGGRSTEETTLMSHNDAGMENVARRVGDIRGISMAIKDHLKKDAAVYDDIAKMYEQNQSMVEKTTRDVGQLLQSSAGKTICYLVLGVLFLLLLLWMLK